MKAKLIFILSLVVPSLCFGKSVKIIFSEQFKKDDPHYILEVKYSFKDESLVAEDIFFNATEHTEIKKDDLYDRQIKVLFKHLVLGLNLPKGMFKKVMDAHNSAMMETAIVDMFIASDFIVSSSYVRDSGFSFDKSVNRYFYFHKNEGRSWKYNPKLP